MSDAKKLVTNLLDDRYGKLSVRRGTGTSRSWIYIETDNTVGNEVRDLVEHHLCKNNLVGRYWPDWGGGETWETNVLWNVR